MALAIDIEDLTDEIIAGKWGNGKDRQDKLREAGLNYHIVQDYVNKKMNGTLTDDDYVFAEKEKQIRIPDTADDREGKWGAAQVIPKADTKQKDTPKLAPQPQRRVVRDTTSEEIGTGVISPKEVAQLNARDLANFVANWRQIFKA